MKAILMPILPKWCELIASGKKTVEVRKTKPKLETPFKVHIYCTESQSQNLIISKVRESYFDDWGHLECFLMNKRDAKCFDKEYRANGKVIGEFVCNKIEEIRQREVFNADVLCSTTCLTIKEFLDYIGNATAYLWHISDLVIYDKPKELSEFRKSGALSYDDWLYSMYNGTSESSYEKYLFPFTLTRSPQSWCYVETEN